MPPPSEALRRTAANPVVPLVDALRKAVSPRHADWVHFGATSQDILDTGAMLVAARALDALLPALTSLSRLLAELAERHRETVMVARTLMQQAVPTSFGLVAAGWLSSVVEAIEAVRRVRTERLAAQLGGAGGTLAAFGELGTSVADAFAAELGLSAPVLPWHTQRGRIADLTAALGRAVEAVDKIALDVILLSQTEIGELREGSAEGRGRSSTMPQKRNPVGAVAVRAAAAEARGAAATLLSLGPHEYQRAAGAWQAEWIPLSDLLGLTLSLATRAGDFVTALEVDADRMRANLDANGGGVMTERIAIRLTPTLGRDAAARLAAHAAADAEARGVTFAAALAAIPEVRAALSDGDIATLLDPRGYLGSAQAFVDRTLAEYRRLIAN